MADEGDNQMGAPRDEVTLETRVEELVERYPKAVGWLTQHGIICVRCGEPFWGTLGELMQNKQIKNPEKLLKKLNEFLS